MTMTQTELEGFAKGFLGLLDEQAAALAGTPLDVPEIRRIVSEKLETAVQKNARQEQAKVDLHESTHEVVVANDDLYRTTSGWLDAVLAAVGKGSRAAQVFQRLRSRVRDPEPAASELPAVQPNPVAKQ